jgi:ATP-dependent RNA helicase DeaD
MTGFSTFGLSEAMIKKLDSIQFTTPTPIQEQSIPLAMAGRDILGTAQTGTGKTAAFGLPLVHHILNKPHSMALVMTPTRELAVQVMTQIKSFLPEGCGIKTALLIGGEAMFKQLNQLQTKPRIIIGTPGRINDHLERDSLRLGKADFLVLDEADRMLDMGFGVQLEAIAEYLPETRQTLMFSATVPPNIMKLAKNYLKDPARVETAAPHLAAPKIKQELIPVNDDSKHAELVKLLDGRSGQIIVFVKTKHGADRLARKLIRENHLADAIHGDLRQGQRDRVIRQFRKNETRILVATDVAARGLDIPMLETVINYDLPQCPEDYIHRIGRTGRNGQEGEAICLITNSDKAKWSAIDRLMNPGKPQEKSAGNSKGNSRGGSGARGRISFAERKYGGGGRSGGDGQKSNWKSSFKTKSPERSFDKPYSKAPRRDEGASGHDDPVVAQAAVEYDRKKAPAKPFSKPFGEKRFGNGFKKDGFKKDGFRQDGPRKDGFKKDWTKSDKPKFDKPKADGVKSDDFKKDGFKKSSFKFGEKKFGDKKFGEKKFGAKSSGSSAGRGDRPAGKSWGTKRPAAAG